MRRDHLLAALGISCGMLAVALFVVVVLCLRG